MSLIFYSLELLFLKKKTFQEGMKESDQLFSSQFEFIRSFLLKASYDQLITKEMEMLLAVMKSR